MSKAVKELDYDIITQNNFQNMTSIELENKVVSYILRVSKRSKKMRLAVYRGGDFVVTVPKSVDESFIEKVLLKRARWIIKKIEYFKKFAPQKSTVATRLHYEEHRKSALSFATERVAHWNQFYGFAYKKISVRNQKTRWGSCSKKGNLSFNYRIAFLPIAIADYIVVHELCHLKAFDHSHYFWSLVMQTTSQYKEIRKELKQIHLHAVLAKFNK